MLQRILIVSYSSCGAYSTVLCFSSAIFGAGILFNKRLKWLFSEKTWSQRLAPLLLLMYGSLIPRVTLSPKKLQQSVVVLPEA